MMKTTIIIACAFAAIASADNKCDYNETQNVKGPGKCYLSVECAGERYCAAWGRCHGEFGDSCKNYINKMPANVLADEVEEIEDRIDDM